MNGNRRCYPIRESVDSKILIGIGQWQVEISVLLFKDQSQVVKTARIMKRMVMILLIHQMKCIGIFMMINQQLKTTFIGIKYGIDRMGFRKTKDFYRKYNSHQHPG